MTRTKRPILKGGGGSKDKEEIQSKKKNDKPPLSKPATRVSEEPLVTREGAALEPPTKKRKADVVDKGKETMTAEHNFSDDSQEENDEDDASVPRDMPSSSGPIDKSVWEDRFVSENAYGIYQVYLTKQTMPEHSLNFHACERSDPDILANIKERGWARFAKGPQIMANLTAVRELYANWDPSKGDIVWVRGRNVDISARAINDYYKASQEAATTYNSMVDDPNNAPNDDILQVLCEPPSDNAQTSEEARIAWGGNTRTAYASIKKEFMTKKARVWHNWVCNRFMQADHQSKEII